MLSTMLGFLVETGQLTEGEAKYIETCLQCQLIPSTVDGAIAMIREAREAYKRDKEKEDKNEQN